MKNKDRRRPVRHGLVPVHIRWMIRRDLPDALGIEDACFARTAKWTEDDFLRVLRQRNAIAVVAEVDEQVVGFAAYELRKTRMVLLRMAVAPLWQNHGVGFQVVETLKSKLSSHRRRRLEVCVRETNLQAQLFFRRQSFLAVSSIRGHFDDTGEDAIVMRFLLGGGGIEMLDSAEQIGHHE